MQGELGHIIRVAIEVLQIAYESNGAIWNWGKSVLLELYTNAIKIEGALGNQINYNNVFPLRCFLDRIRTVINS